jgi:hypothetical protein
VASSVAIVLWSAAILNSTVFARALGIYGCILGPLTIMAVLSGHIRLNVHGFGLVVLGQAIWFITAVIQLWQQNHSVEKVQHNNALSRKTIVLKNDSIFPAMQQHSCSQDFPQLHCKFREKLILKVTQYFFIASDPISQ